MTPSAVSVAPLPLRMKRVSPIPFQLLDCPGQRGLRDGQTLCRPVEGAGFCDGNDVIALLEEHFCHLNDPYLCWKYGQRDSRVLKLISTPCIRFVYHVNLSSENFALNQKVY